MKNMKLALALFAVLPLSVAAQTAPAPAPKPAAPATQPAAPAKAPAAENAPAATTPATAPTAESAAVPLPKPVPTVVSREVVDTTGNDAATVVLVTGSVTARSDEGTRTLSSGSVVRSGETLTVGPNSYANLKFTDGGRVLLRPNTEFIVEAYRFTPEPVQSAAADTPATKPTAEVSTGQAFFRLVRGGFRAISGLIGKSQNQDYKVTTPVATIGIRGTDYEVQTCSDDCPSDQLPDTAGAEPTLVASNDLSGLQLAQAGGGGGGGILVATNDGSIVMQTPRGMFRVDIGQVAYALTGGQVFMLPVVPDALLLNMTPSPAACD